MGVDVVGVGASCVDQVCRLPVFPEAGGPRAKVRVQEQTRTCGGQIATALATCASLGLRATYLGAVGEDDDGRRIRSELAARGIDLSQLHAGAAPTATATILLDATGDDGGGVRQLVVEGRGGDDSFSLFGVSVATRIDGGDGQDSLALDRYTSIQYRPTSTYAGGVLLEGRQTLEYDGVETLAPSPSLLRAPLVFGASDAGADLTLLLDDSATLVEILDKAKLGEDQSHQGAGQRKQHALRQQLSNDPPATRAQGGADRNLLAAGFAASQEKVGDVRAGNAQHQQQLEEAILRAREQVPFYRAAAFRVQSSQELYKASLGPYLPSVDATAGFDRNITTAQEFNTQVYDLTASYTLFDGGRRRANRNISRLTLDTDRETLRASLLDLEFSVKSAFYTVTAQKETLEQRNLQLRDSQKDYEVAEGRYKFGVAKLSDLLEASVRLEQARFNTVQAEGNLNKAFCNLNSLLTKPLQERYEIQGALDIDAVLPPREALYSAALEQPEIRRAENASRYRRTAGS